VAHYKTIVISDLHLGIKSAKAKEVVFFLKHNSCDKLIMNGDIIDGWQLRRSGKWKKKHTRFFKLVMKYISKRKTEVIYLRGNHDDFLDEILPFKFGRLSIVNQHIHTSNGKRYYVIHGDVFDSITTNMRWLAKLGDVSYTFLLWLNRHYNNYRVKRGLPYYSLSKEIKQRVKSAVSFIDDFEKQLSSMAKSKKCDGIICGHIHSPANRMIDGIHYLNSGDWVESLTALTEDYEGNWQVVEYSSWIKTIIPTNIPNNDTPEDTVLASQLQQLLRAI
jgi:UDP-2,3-diacylglucosamine pyrophosphatase LpxH